MGDRAQVKIIDSMQSAKDQGQVYLYTHWDGTELVEDVRTALKREQRWDDAPYLTRIIFDEMTKGCQGSETGNGIMTYEVSDASHDLIVVDTKTQTITVKNVSQSFEAFINED